MAEHRGGRSACRASAITVIPNGVDVARFGATAADGRGSLGLQRRIADDRQRRLPRARARTTATLLDALALLSARGRAFHAVLVGDGPERAALEQRAQALGHLRRACTSSASDPTSSACCRRWTCSCCRRARKASRTRCSRRWRPDAPRSRPRWAEPARCSTDGETGWLVPPQLARAPARGARARRSRGPDEATRRGAGGPPSRRDRARHRRDGAPSRALLPRAGRARRPSSERDDDLGGLRHHDVSHAGRLHRERGASRCAGAASASRCSRSGRWAPRYQPEHQALVGITRAIGSPPRSRAWWRWSAGRCGGRTC